MREEEKRQWCIHSDILTLCGGEMGADLLKYLRQSIWDSPPGRSPDAVQPNPVGRSFFSWSVLWAPVYGILRQPLGPLQDGTRRMPRELEDHRGFFVSSMHPTAPLHLLVSFPFSAFWGCFLGPTPAWLSFSPAVGVVFGSISPPDIRLPRRITHLVRVEGGDTTNTLG